MKKDYLHLCVVLDASGSMGAIKDDVKGTFNTFIAEQRRQPGQTVLDVYQFSDESTRIVKRENLANFNDDLMKNYECTGCTALNDAVCLAIDEIGAEFAALPEEERPEHVLVAILTDGYENASKKYSGKDVKERVERQTNVYRWQFVFLAAEIDAKETGASLGIQAQDCVSFDRSESGINFACCKMSERANFLRRPDSNK